MALRRGFKAEAERLAKEIWGGMGLEPGDSLDALSLAKHVGCDVRSAAQLVDITKLEELRRIQDDAFFACTFKLPDGRHAIVYNPLMKETRINSDVAHEVAHIVLKHRLSRLQRIGKVAFHSCDSQQEEEASWLSGCLLLPRFAIAHDLRKRFSHSTIADRRRLSREMVEYRIRVTGVARQFAAAGHRKIPS